MIKNDKIKDQFSAYVKVGNRVGMFMKSADSEALLVQLLKKHGLGVSNIVTIKKFQVEVKEEKGRTKSKY